MVNTLLLLFCYGCAAVCVGRWILRWIIRTARYQAQAHAAGMARCRSDFVRYTTDDLEAKLICTLVREATGRPEKACTRIPHPRCGHGWRIEADGITDARFMQLIEERGRGLADRLRQELGRHPTEEERLQTLKEEVEHAYWEGNGRFCFGVAEVVLAPKHG